MQFPQYRKLINERSFYRIDSFDSFTELQKIGTRVLVYTIKAEQYPEKLKILDMLKVEDPNFVVSNEIEFNSLFQQL